MTELCVWCKERSRLEGLALCGVCHGLQESDEKNQHVVEKDYHFRCPECGEDIGGRIICPKCGVIRMSLMSLPSHCSRCHSQFNYKDKHEVTRCWMCRAKWRESSIDWYINFALTHWEQYKEWYDSLHRKVIEDEG